MSAGMSFSSASWRMMSSWRSGSVTSRSASSSESRRVTPNPIATPAATAARIASTRRPRSLTARLPVAELRDDLRYACVEVLERAVVDDHVRRSLSLLVLGELASGPALQRGEVASPLARVAQLVVRDHRDDGVEHILHPGLEEQRHLDDPDGCCVRQLGDP